jgi:hypothetical protein
MSVEVNQVLSLSKTFIMNLNYAQHNSSYCQLSSIPIPCVVKYKITT